MVRCWSLDQSGGPTLLCCKNKIVLESTYKFKKLSQLRHLCCSLQKRCYNEIKNAELGANRCIKFNFRALIIFLSSSVLHPADAAWINLLIFSFFSFCNYALFCSSMLSGLQEEFHDPMKLIRNPLYYSEDAARWKKTSLFFWILLVLAVWTVIYVFMCDVLWSKNRGAWLRGTIFPPNFSLNWRFIQNPYMLSRFQGPGVDESRSKLWWNNFINVDKNGEKEVVYPKLLSRVINNLIMRLLETQWQEENFTSRWKSVAQMVQGCNKSWL